MSAASATGQVGNFGYAYPVGGNLKPGDTDNGVDFEGNPGSPLFAVDSGTIVSTQGAFPGGSIVLQLDHAIKGHRWVYYGHLDDASKRVKTGQRVKAGQQIAVTSKRPPGAESMPGHTEIGFARGASGVIQTGGPAGGRRNANAPTWGKDFRQFLAISKKFSTTSVPDPIDAAKGAVDDVASKVVQGIFGMIAPAGAKILLTAVLVIAGVALAGFGLVKATGTEGAVKTVAKVAAVV